MTDTWHAVENTELRDQATYIEIPTKKGKALRGDGHGRAPPGR